MSTPCPDPGFWVDFWTSGELPGSERDRWEAHLADCADCRAELAALSEALPSAAPLVRAFPRRLVWAAAAASLLLGIVLFRGPGKPSGPETPPAPSTSGQAPSFAEARTGSVPAATVPQDLMLGRSAEVTLAAGASGKAEGTSGFRLLGGEAWIEALEPVRATVEGLDGFVELGSGTLALKRLAAPGACLLTLLTGEAELVRGSSRRRLAPGEGLRWAAAGAEPESWTPGARPAWSPGSPSGFPLRDAVRSLAAGPEGKPRAVEILLRKREPSAEADLLFRAGGGTWRVPLGSHLPAGNAWVRVRLERGGGRIRLLAGGRELFSREEAALGAVCHPEPDFGDLGVRAWGGDVEVGTVRWRG